MEIQYLQEFVSITQCGSFSLAADEMHLAQPTISRHIKALEDELNTTLFLRNTRKVQLSLAGKVLLPYARQMIKLYAEFDTEYQAYLKNVAQSVSIGSIPMLAQYGITTLISQFKQLHPNVTIHIQERQAAVELLYLLTQEQFHFAFVRDNFGHPDNMEIIDYCTDTLVAVFPKTHQMAEKETVSLKELAQEEFLLMDEQTYVYDLCIRAFIRAGVSPMISFTGKRPENIIEMVSNKMGVGLLMKKVLLYSNNPAVSFAEIVPTVTSRIQLVRIRDKPLGHAANFFWTYVKKNTKMVTDI